MTHSEDGRECQHQRTHYSQRNGGEHVCSNCGESIIGDEQKARVRKTWKAGNPSWTCANCNNPIMQHEKQTFCPEGPAFASNSTSAQPARQSCEFHDNDSEACEKYSGRVPCEPARQVGDEQSSAGDAWLWHALRSQYGDESQAEEGFYAGWKARAAHAPAAVVMPCRADERQSERYMNGWNSALDEVARLNRRAIPAGLLERSERHLTNWLELNACECEGFHVCGRNEVKADRDELRALLGKEGER